jgi:hypothetical protein
MGFERAAEAGLQPLREFMIRQTREADLMLMLDVSQAPPPQDVDEVRTVHLVPAFMLSELKTAFQIGFVVFLPFLPARHRGVEHPHVDGHADGAADDDLAAAQAPDVRADRRLEPGGEGAPRKLPLKPRRWSARTNRRCGRTYLASRDAVLRGRLIERYLPEVHKLAAHAYARRGRSRPSSATTCSGDASA